VRKGRGLVGRKEWEREGGSKEVRKEVERRKEGTGKGREEGE